MKRRDRIVVLPLYVALVRRIVSHYHGTDFSMERTSKVVEIFWRSRNRKGDVQYHLARPHEYPFCPPFVHPNPNSGILEAA